MFVVVEDCNTNMTTYLAWPEHCNYGNNNNHVVMSYEMLHQIWYQSRACVNHETLDTLATTIL
jgi:hypothetical protein